MESELARFELLTLVSSPNNAIEHLRRQYQRSRSGTPRDACDQAPHVSDESMPEQAKD